MSSINAGIILATRASEDARNGLVTVEIDVPYYIWVEILTHKRFARNASSARAQKLERHVSYGYYTPPVFYKSGTGMQSSNEPIENQSDAMDVYDSVWTICLAAAEKLVKLGVAKEQANRVIPPIKMIKGLMTGTEDAWNKFFELRDHPSADKAMQIFAKTVKQRIDETTWNISSYHFPFIENKHNNIDDILEAAAKIARISYSKPQSGKSDLELGKSLLESKHLSPFEHLAYSCKLASSSALYCKAEDVYWKPNDNKRPIGPYKWQNIRSDIENLGEKNYILGMAINGI